MNPGDVAKITIAEFEKGKEVIIPGKTSKMFMFLDVMLPMVIKKGLTRNVI